MHRGIPLSTGFTKSKGSCHFQDILFPLAIRIAVQFTVCTVITYTLFSCTKSQCPQSYGSGYSPPVSSYRPASFPRVPIPGLLVQASPWFHQKWNHLFLTISIPQPTSGHASSFPLHRTFSGPSVVNHATHFPWNHIVSTSHMTFSKQISLLQTLAISPNQDYPQGPMVISI